MPVTRFTDAYFFLSNFYAPAPVVLDGETYPTTEHAYQAAKTLDLHERERIRNAPKPGAAKRMGRSIERGGIVTLRTDWDQVKYEIMLDLCRQKFAASDLRAKLLATGYDHLMEGNTWGDTYWGVCKGVGENRLGLILMCIRAELRESLQ